MKIFRTRMAECNGGKSSYKMHAKGRMAFRLLEHFSSLTSPFGKSEKSVTQFTKPYIDKTRLIFGLDVFNKFLDSVFHIRIKN